MESILTAIKDIFTIVIAGTATIISIFAYRRARSTLFEPIRSEVIKKQSAILTDVLEFLSEHAIDKNLEYEELATINALQTLLDFGFVFSEHKNIQQRAKEKIVGWIWTGEGTVIHDVEVISAIMPEKSAANSSDIEEHNKQRFENALKGSVSIERIYLTANHANCVKQLSKYSDSPFLPTSILAILKKIILDINTNLNFHLYLALEKFATDYFKEYTAGKKYPSINPLGLYNEFNHVRARHEPDLIKLNDAIRKYLRIDEKW